jgi:K+-sensing histidine kinase KdpD
MTDTPAKLPTMFAPAERATSEEVQRLARHIESERIVRLLVDAVPNVMMILNQERQIVLANRALARAIGHENLEQVLGLRPGEALDCIHAEDEPAGCGTTEFCRTCGAAKAIVMANTGIADVQECHILRQKSGDALDFRVFTTPLNIGEEKFTVFVLDDISSDNRRRALERVFFHDVLNTAGGLRAAADIMAMVPETERDEIRMMIHRFSSRLIDEITSQRDLSAAESGELIPRPEPCDPATLVESIAELYRTHNVGKGKTITVRKPAEAREFVVDRTLLGRVLGNMLKNALEASNAGETVTIAYEFDRSSVTFRVNNFGAMPRDIQLQMFQRSFSTKGMGRGLGTYSIKLLGERYLNGSVWFTTNEDSGTTFYVKCPLAADAR